MKLRVPMNTKNELKGSNLAMNSSSRYRILSSRVRTRGSVHTISGTFQVTFFQVLSVGNVS